VVISVVLSVLGVYSGTHGYMAPEVLAKGVAYDSSADWFSFGCMLYKLLRGSVDDTLSLSVIGLSLVSGVVSWVIDDTLSLSVIALSLVSGNVCFLEI